VRNIEEKYCVICAKAYSEEHHIIFRSKARFLVNCDLNKIFLCEEHHRGKQGVHAKNGHTLDKKLKSDFEEKLNLLFDKDNFTREEIRKTLNISDRATDSLCKLLKCQKGVFSRVDIIRACMGR
jgi:hypothetical protein